MLQHVPAYKRVVKIHLESLQLDSRPAMPTSSPQGDPHPNQQHRTHSVPTPLHRLQPQQQWQQQQPLQMTTHSACSQQQLLQLGRVSIRLQALINHSSKCKPGMMMSSAC
jgi:hypothetical protein